MVKVLLSIVLGCAITGLVFLYGSIPRESPSVAVVILVLPFQIVARLIADNGIAGEIVYFGSQVIFWSGTSLVFVFLADAAFKRKDHK